MLSFRHDWEVLGNYIQSYPLGFVSAPDTVFETESPTCLPIISALARSKPPDSSGLGSLPCFPHNHQQVWIKVNCQVDVGIKEVVSLLNSVEGLLTLASCQGEAGQRDAYVYFLLGNWQNLCQFVFGRIGPHLKQKFGEGVQAIVEAADADSPIAKLSFRAEVIEPLASALKDILR